MVDDLLRGSGHEVSFLYTYHQPASHSARFFAVGPADPKSRSMFEDFLGTRLLCRLLESDGYDSKLDLMCRPPLSNVVFWPDAVCFFIGGGNRVGAISAGVLWPSEQDRLRNRPRDFFCGLAV